ncbi:MAG TPA: GNAT family N-acetyltransferase [Allosphingosinicella sp.]|jgi:ribosomal protein S18 acetylase RimI-like enzyme
MASDADRDLMLKSMAANRGCKLVKSRKRTPGTGDYGRYGLKDGASDREVFGFGADGLLTATPEEIEAFLRKGATADWKSSLLAAAAGAAPANDERTPVPRSGGKAKPKAKTSAPRAGPKLRVVDTGEEVPAPPPPPPPEPPPPPPAPRAILKIREARPADAEALAALIGSDDAKALAARISAMRKAGEPPLVADEGGALLGLCSFHAVPLVQEDAPLGRITFLHVDSSARRRGLGRALVEEAAARLADLGCTRVEALAEIELAAAPDFYRRLGWTRNAYRYATDTGASPPR